MSDQPISNVSNPPQPAAVPKGYDYPDDKFRHGVIIKFTSQSNYGFVRDIENREVYFHLDELRFCGEKGHRSFIREGTHVGFDVGLTSRGLRVTRMKPY